MLKVGLVGLGSMGRNHLNIYRTLEKEGVARVKAICDIDSVKFEGRFTNNSVTPEQYAALELDRYDRYTALGDMLADRSLDYIDIVIPIDMHMEASTAAMEAGFHVLCEKPMAYTAEECARMIACSHRTGRRLMIAQCLRFTPAYEYLKEAVDSGRYGAALSGYFYRGGGTPRNSYENWLLNRRRSQGAALDQHVHDVDTIQWLFGLPQRVSSSGRTVFPGSGFDAISTHYYYPDGKVINAQDDWSFGGKIGFSAVYRVNFEKASMTSDSRSVRVFPKDGEAFSPELDPETGVIREIRYFCRRLLTGAPFDICPPESTLRTVAIASAEIRSAERAGKPVDILP